MKSKAGARNHKQARKLRHGYMNYFVKEPVHAKKGLPRKQYRSMVWRRKQLSDAEPADVGSNADKAPRLHFRA